MAHQEHLCLLDSYPHFQIHIHHHILHHTHILHLCLAHLAHLTLNLLHTFLLSVDHLDSLTHLGHHCGEFHPLNPPRQLTSFSSLQ